MRYLYTDEQLEGFRAEVKSHFSDIEDVEILKGIGQTIQGHVSELTAPIREHKAGVGFHTKASFD